MSFTALLIDDSQDDRALVARELKRQFEGAVVLEAGTPEALADILEQGRFDIAITDYRLRFNDGIAVLRELKRRFPERPVIMFTASGNEEVAVAAMKEGLDDYITKTPKHYPRIGYAVRSCLEQVSQRFQLGQALARESLAKARLEIALQSAGMATWQIDLQSREVAGSDSLGPMFGYPPGHQFAGLDAWLAHVHPDDRAEVAASRAAALAGGTSYQLQFRAPGADGETRWIASSGRVLRDAAGQPTHIIGTARDVTADLAIRHNLERKTEQLEKADHQKNEFLSILAHELRNPLAAARYSIALLRQGGATSATIGRATEVIDRQIGHMARLLDELLDLSRITHKRITLEQQVLDIRKIVELACESGQSALQGRGHRLALSLPLDPVLVLGDEVRLTQVFANLLSNAAKFTPAGGQVEVRVGQDAQQVWIDVIDDGIGIEPARLEDVFEMFLQMETKIHGGTPGLGIGLAVVRSLVTLHGGSVSAHSEGAGQGTRIRVRLPLAPAQHAPLPAPAAELAPSGSGRLRVLVADDNVDAVELLAEFLRAEGYEVHMAFDGRAAIELARSAQPDVVVLDIGMPGANGYEVAHWVREQPWGARTTLVAVTGWGQEHDGDRARRAGFDLRLVKPVDIPQLLGALVTRTELQQ
jgi:two-component system CheB/CheR fusion protein